MKKIKDQSKKSESEYNYNAINLFRNCNSGILSTISKRNYNYPFGSYTTFISSKDRKVYFYLSDIAQHTINFKANPKACLTISKEAETGDVQESQRLTLMGDIKSVKQSDLSYCQTKFHSIFPESKKYIKFHSFNFYQLEINCIRWIGGFGKIAWLEVKDWENYTPGWNDYESAIITHMNSDHSNSIISSLYAQHNIKDKTAKMIFLTIDGYYIEAKESIYFIQFNTKCTTRKQYKKELTNLAKKYRKFEL